MQLVSDSCQNLEKGESIWILSEFNKGSHPKQMCQITEKNV